MLFVITKAWVERRFDELVEQNTTSFPRMHCALSSEAPPKNTNREEVPLGPYFSGRIRKIGSRYLSDDLSSKSTKVTYRSWNDSWLHFLKILKCFAAARLADPRAWFFLNRWVSHLYNRRSPCEPPLGAECLLQSVSQSVSKDLS